MNIEVTSLFNILHSVFDIFTLINTLQGAGGLIT
jgi:hypothetical protein